MIMLCCVEGCRTRRWEGVCCCDDEGDDVGRGNRIGTATIVERALLEMRKRTMKEACLWKCVPVSLDAGGV